MGGSQYIFRFWNAIWNYFSNYYIFYFFSFLFNRIKYGYYMQAAFVSAFIVSGLFHFSMTFLFCRVRNFLLLCFLSLQTKQELIFKISKWKNNLMCGILVLLAFLDIIPKIVGDAKP